jgi:hypothetical protein
MTADQPRSPGQPPDPADPGGRAAQRLREQMQRDLGGIPAGHHPGRPAGESDAEPDRDDEREEDGAREPSGEESA